MINAIKIQKNNENIYYDEERVRLTYLSGLNRINIFIGENNSGKSRLLRELVKCENDYCLRTVDNSSSINNARVQLSNSVNNFNKYASQKYRENLCFSINKESDPIMLLLEVMKQINSEKYNDNNDELDEQLKHSLKSIRNNTTNLENCITPIIRNINQKELKTRIYIPVLRGIESFQNYYGSSNSNLIDEVRMNKKERDALEEYKNSVKTIYGNKISTIYGMSDKNIFTGENLYEEILSKLLGLEKDRLFVNAFQDFISTHFFEKETFQLIPIKEEGFLNVKIGKRKERALHDLGDGIKQIICMLYKIFEYRDQEALFFIEEPEINLHPAYQRKFIELLQSEEFNKAQFFITTHSNHLVDSCFDSETISIFKFINIENKNNRFSVIKTTRGDIELLDLLGVNNSSVFMSNSTIWVEGLSDKIYINKYLQVYIEERNEKQFIEDIDYSFVEYGGNNITHWSFIPDQTIDKINASGITNRLFVIADNDSDRKKKRKERLRSVLGDYFYELPVREIENTIKQSILEKTLFPDGNIQILKKEKYKNAKYTNKQARVFEFIDDHYVTNTKYWDKKRGNTKKNKIEFAKEITKNINTIDDLSKEALELCDAIYSFLKKEHAN